MTASMKTSTSITPRAGSRSTRKISGAAARTASPTSLAWPPGRSRLRSLELAPARAGPGDAKDQAELGELRGFDLEPAGQRDPGLRPVHPLPRRAEHGEQQQQRHAVDHRRPSAEPAVVDARDDEHQDDPEHRPTAAASSGRCAGRGPPPAVTAPSPPRPAPCRAPSARMLTAISSQSHDLASPPLANARASSERRLGANVPQRGPAHAADGMPTPLIGRTVRALRRHLAAGHRGLVVFKAVNTIPDLPDCRSRGVGAETGVRQHHDDHVLRVLAGGE